MRSRPIIQLSLAICLSSFSLLTLTTLAQDDTGSKGQQLARRHYIPHHAIIAHRGDSYAAPEATRPAYLLARDSGADYLELDLQRTRDGHLIALHDTNLKRTTNIEDVFPERADEPVSQFSLKEIKQLDAGSWFNEKYPQRARDSFKDLKILTLDEVRQIAEAGHNQPGLYLETKEPKLFPGIEKDLQAYLQKHDWIGDNARTAPSDFDKQNAVAVGYGPARVILQTFSRHSLEHLARQMPDIPKILLLGMGDDPDELPADPAIKRRDNESKADYRARQKLASRQDYDQALDFARQQGAIGVGPSATRQDRDTTYSYADLARRWMIRHAHDRGLLVHVYTLDNAKDYKHYFQRGIDGAFANDPRALLKFEKRPPEQSTQQILDKYGY